MYVLQNFNKNNNEYCVLIPKISHYMCVYFHFTILCCPTTLFRPNRNHLNYPPPPPPPISYPNRAAYRGNKTSPFHIPTNDLRTFPQLIMTTLVHCAVRPPPALLSPPPPPPRLLPLTSSRRGHIDRPEPNGPSIIRRGPSQLASRSEDSKGAGLQEEQVHILERCEIIIGPTPATPSIKKQTRGPWGQVFTASGLG